MTSASVIRSWQWPCQSGNKKTRIEILGRIDNDWQVIIERNRRGYCSHPLGSKVPLYHHQKLLRIIYRTWNKRSKLRSAKLSRDIALKLDWRSNLIREQITTSSKNKEVFSKSKCFGWTLSRKWAIEKDNFRVPANLYAITFFIIIVCALDVHAVLPNIGLTIPDSLAFSSLEPLQKKRFYGLSRNNELIWRHVNELLVYTSNQLRSFKTKTVLETVTNSILVWLLGGLAQLLPCSHWW